MAEIKTITIPTDTQYPSAKYAFEFPSRICLVCGKTEREAAKVVCTGDAWLCDRCKSTLLKLIKENEEK